MKTKISGLVCAAIVPLMAGCVSTSTALSPVGPSPAGQAAVVSPAATGALQVYSATEKSLPVASDEATTFNLHSGYVIRDAAGEVVKFVANHASDMDEWPDQVTLPAGNYNLLARSSQSGQVAVPVVIEAGKTTVVHLDNNWSPPANTTASQIVYLPDGAAVGWSDAGTKVSE